jgi:CubicO group peptidase (beta-lactamase class C family)
MFLFTQPKGFMNLSILKKISIIKLGFLLVMSFSLSGSLSAQNTVSTYPDTTWMRYATPEEAGWSSEGIDKARAFADSLGSKAVILVYDGAIVAEWGFTEDLAPIASIRKSLFSALMGIAVAEGLIDTTSSLADLGINDISPLSEEEKQANIHHLLTTSSGVFHKAAAESPALSKPERGSAKPGEQWFYNNWDFNVLATIYENETGRRIFDAFDEQVAKPIGMEHYHPDWGSYTLQPNRSKHPAYDLWMSARDMARFGLLFLSNGSWNDKPIVPADWVENSGRVHKEIPGEHAAGYGLSWWVPAGPLEKYGAYLASGSGNQLITILPELNIVFVQRASSVLDDGVFGLDVREILYRLLDARTGDESEQPELVPVSR